MRNFLFEILICLFVALSLSAAPDLQPVPQKIVGEFQTLPLESVRLELVADGFPALPLAQEYLEKRFEALGVKLLDEDDASVPSVTMRIAVQKDAAPEHPEGYSIRLCQETPATLTVSGRDNRGAFYGTLRVLEGLRGERSAASLQIADMDDWPTWLRRAIATDAGKIYESSLRLSLQEGFNTFAYQHRFPGWQNFETKENKPNLNYKDTFQMMEKYAKEYELLDAMLLLHIYDNGSGNSPLDISNEADINLLIDKCTLAAWRGVKHIMICVDDHTPIQNGRYACLYNGEREKFGSIGAAQGYLMQRLSDALQGYFQFLELSIVIPPYSLNRHNCLDPEIRTYFDDLMTTLPAHIPIVWTGAEILSRTVTKEDFETYSSLIPGHGLYLWDNSIWLNTPCYHWDTNFYDGFEKDSWNSLIFVNFRNHCFLSEAICAMTTGAYLWNPHDFQPLEAYRIAYERKTGDDFGPMAACVPDFKQLRYCTDTALQKKLVPELEQLVPKVKNAEIRQPMESQLKKMRAVIDANLPEINLPFFGKEPVLDGNPDDEIWKHGAEVTLQYHDKTLPSENNRAILKMGWTREAFYILAECRSSKPLVSRQKLRPRDDRVFEADDVLEFFLSNRYNYSYRHLALDFEGHIWDAPKDPDHAGEWNPDWQFAISRPDEMTWIAEIRIPFKDLWLDDNENSIQPFNGFQWHINICREHRKGGQTLQSWSPPGFHEPRVFGLVNFVE